MHERYTEITRSCQRGSYRDGIREKECDNSLDKVKESVYNYTKPIINHKVGNTIDHGHVGF